MEFSFSDFLSSSKNQLPVFDSLDEYINYILPILKPHSEDLRESDNFLDKRWLEIRDNDNFHESILHIFQEKGDYLISIDGNVSKARWKILENPNVILLERGSSELFELVFLNKEFMILSKHGNQTRKNKAQYFVLGFEPVIKRLEWREVAETLYYRHKKNQQDLLLTIMFLALIIVLILVYFNTKT